MVEKADNKSNEKILANTPEQSAHVSTADEVGRGAANDPILYYPRGSEWRQWDLHIHSPASFHWEGEKLSPSGDQPKDIVLIDRMIEAMNSATPAVFAIMDYWTFDGWFALQNRLKQDDAPKLLKTVFPGIELRISAPMEGRLNLHAIFSDKINDQHLKDFISNLKVTLIDQPLSKEALINYAQRAGEDKLEKHGYKKSEVESDRDIALDAGYKIAELSVESYKDALSKIPDELGLGYVPFNTNDGLGSVKWNEHYAYAMSLFKDAPIFEARDDATSNAFVGRKTSENESWINNFQAALGNNPRLPVSGSDSHKFIGVEGDNNNRGYGDYPSGRITWIKADPTWLGLQQAIKEPAKRCYIGEEPEKQRLVSERKTFYIDQVTVKKVDGSALDEQWFDKCVIPMNSDLVVIIGNKGSGKSALADIIALVGNSGDKDKFSFLKIGRFRGRSGDPAKQFIGRLDWIAGEPCECNLGENPPAERTELVRYIPQGRFEELCNDHVSGKSGLFEKALRAVVFDHLSVDIRLEAHTFEELIEEQEKVFRAKLDDARQRLSEINRSIENIENDLHPNVKGSIEDLLEHKERELAELKKAKPKEEPKPSNELTQEQASAASKISAAEKNIIALNAHKNKNAERLQSNAVKKHALKSAQDQIHLFETQFNGFKRNLAVELEKIGVLLDDVIALTVNTDKLDEIQSKVSKEDTAIKAEKISVSEGLAIQKKSVEQETLALNGPQQRYQAYQVKLIEWQKKIDAISGSDVLPESVKGLQKRILRIEKLPNDLQKMRDDRLVISKEIFTILTTQRTAREQLFSPLQDTIEINPLIGEEYDLKFKANLQTFTESISRPLFDIVKQNVGEMRGEDDSKQAIQIRLDDCNMDKVDDALAFADSVHELLHTSARQVKPEGNDISPILRKDRSATEAYDFLYGFEYLSPHYTLLFQETPIEQLSPGQRGALLLIFYLLVDKGRNPIILDQPEENLDNETIVNLLVPVLAYAKEMRQIFMVTHNPNLAVVCDAEQIIMARLDRKDGARITYEAGSIESPSLNSCVVNVLEGTKVAFDNRGGKYQ